MERVTAGGARRITLAAQGFADRRPKGRVDIRTLRRVVDRMAVLQIDSVNVLSRSHYLPLFSRLGPYDRTVLDSMFEKRRELFEFWAHEASYVDIRLYPALRWRMEGAPDQAWGSMVALQRDRPGFVDKVLGQVRDEGPLTAAVLRPDAARRPGTMWNWHEGKVALEWLFYTGVISAVRRTQAFERVYDLTDRVIPPAIRNAPTMSKEEATRVLIRTAARAHGIATERDLRDYFRLRPLASKLLVARVDLKADRQAGVLRVQSAHAERRIDVGSVSQQLATELSYMAAWMGLDRVEVGDRGDLAEALRAAP